MKWLPYHRFELVSPLAPDAAVSVMSNHIEPWKLFRLAWPNTANDRRFEGSTSGDGFSVRRIMGYRNSFMPAVDGLIYGHGSGSRIVITMRPLIIVIVFIAAWCVAVGSTLATDAWPFGLIMLTFLYLIAMGGFWFEAVKIEGVLREIFQAQAAQSSTPLVS